MIKIEQSDHSTVSSLQFKLQIFLGRVELQPVATSQWLERERKRRDEMEPRSENGKSRQLNAIQWTGVYVQILWFSSVFVWWKSHNVKSKNTFIVRFILCFVVQYFGHKINVFCVLSGCAYALHFQIFAKHKWR